jgi:HlyD family secretion protein
VARSASEGLRGLRLAQQQAENRSQQLRRELALTTVRAPFAGQLAEVFGEVGEFVSQGSRAFRVLDVSRLKLQFQVPVADAARLSIGQSLAVLVDGRPYQAKLTRSSKAALESRLVAFEGELLNNKTTKNAAINNPAVLVGSSTSVQYRLTIASGTLIPLGALRATDEKASVLQVKDKKTLETTVTILGEAAGQVAVAGLAPGSSLVYPIPSGLAGGQMVEVVK